MRKKQLHTIAKFIKYKYANCLHPDIGFCLKTNLVFDWQRTPFRISNRNITQPYNLS
jgi:hypothetical protein